MRFAGSHFLELRRDRQRFILIQDKDQDAAPRQVHVTLNWSQELQRLLRERRERAP